MSESDLDSDLPQHRPDEAPPPSALPSGPAGLLVRITFVAGSIAMLLAMATETLAVLGRRIGVPLIGSIELVQACVVVATSSAIVGATVLGAHASVHLLTERLKPLPRALLERLANLVSAGVFAVLAWGSIWIAGEQWGGEEHTQLLGIPVAPLRIFWCASATLTALLFLLHAIRPVPQRGGHAWRPN